MNRVMSIVVSLRSILLVGPPVAAAQRPVVLEFEKQWAAPDYYLGTVEGGGTIEMTLFDKSVIGNTQHFSATVEVNSARRSSTALGSAQINFSPGRGVRTGRAASRRLPRGRAREHRGAGGPDTGRFIG